MIRADKVGVSVYRRLWAFVQKGVYVEKGAANIGVDHRSLQRQTQERQRSVTYCRKTVRVSLDRLSARSDSAKLPLPSLR